MEHTWMHTHTDTHMHTHTLTHTHRHTHPHTDTHTHTHTHSLTHIDRHTRTHTHMQAPVKLWQADNDTMSPVATKIYQHTCPPPPNFFHFISTFSNNVVRGEGLDRRGGWGWTKTWAFQRKWLANEKTHLKEFLLNWIGNGDLSSWAFQRKWLANEKTHLKEFLLNWIGNGDLSSVVSVWSVCLIRACARVISLASVLWPRHTSPKRGEPLGVKHLNH